MLIILIKFYQSWPFPATGCEAMKLRNVLLLFLAGGSLAVGGGLIYARRVRALMEWIVYQSLRKLGDESGDGRVSASEIYFFIWAVEKADRRQLPDLSFPG